MVRNVNLTIDGISVTVPEGTSILTAARGVGINIPSLCYLKDINEIAVTVMLCQQKLDIYPSGFSYSG